MTIEDSFIHEKFAIDEIYIHKGLSSNLLEKLYQRAVFSLDGDDPIIQKYTSWDMVLIFHKMTLTPNLIYRFLKAIDQDKNKEFYLKSNTLINDDELFAAVKSKKFALVTQKVLMKETYNPSIQ